jgi:hypothetical protein
MALSYQQPNGQGGRDMQKLMALVVTAAMVVYAGCPRRLKQSGPALMEGAGRQATTGSFTYREACGSQGPVTVCVDEITRSGADTLVSARIRNFSAGAYQHGYPSKAAVLLTDDANDELELAEVKSAEHLGAGDARLKFRMGGHLAGTPHTLTVQNIRKYPIDKPPYQLEKQFSLVVQLAGRLDQRAFGSIVR